MFYGPWYQILGSRQVVALYFKAIPNLIDFYKWISYMLFLFVLKFHRMTRLREILP